jgi:glycosyltransferase involved in cell wall biosynthesis
MKHKKMKIAVLGAGAHTIPSYRALLTTLAEKYNITVFSEVSLPKAANRHYTIIAYPFRYNHRWVRYAWLLGMLLYHQFFKRYAVIHSHSTYPTGAVAIVIKKIFRVPLIVSLDAAEAVALPAISFGDVLDKKRFTINRWVTKHAEEVTVLTKFQAKDVLQSFNLENVRIITRGVPIPPAERDVYVTKTDPIVFLNVAYIHPVKDQACLLRCFASLRKQLSCKLIHVGKDYSNGSIQQLAQELEVDKDVEFRGFIPHDNIHHVYSSAHILLHTSQFESQGVVVNEALSYGLLVCGTRAGLIADLENKVTLAVNSGDYNGLAEKVLRLIDDTNLQRTLHQNRKAWISKHDLRYTANEYDALYTHVKPRIV